MPTTEQICVMCFGTGWKPALDDPDRVTRCDCWLARQRLCAEGVPLEFARARLDTYPQKPGNRQAVKLAEAFLGGTRDLYLCGGVGAGKTGLACAVLNDHHDATRGGFFIRVPRLLYELQPTKDEDRADRAKDLEYRVAREPLIVLDDLAAERDEATDYTRRTLLMLYEMRCDEGLRTIWTSNKSLEALGRHQDDDRLASRIAGRCDVVELTCPDQRIVERKRARE